jgi:hypothetical protein
MESEPLALYNCVMYLKNRWYGIYSMNKTGGKRKLFKKEKKERIFIYLPKAHSIVIFKNVTYRQVFGT